MQRAQDLTTIEQPTLDLWNNLLDDGDSHAATRVVLAGLDAEHFVSVIPLNPADMTDQMFEELQGLLSVSRALGIPIPRIPHLEERQPQPPPVIVQGQRETVSPRRAARKRS